MAPPHYEEAVQKEGRLSLALSAIHKNQFSSYRSAAAVYKVPRATLQDRGKGRLSRLGSRSKTRLLLELEESVLISWIHSMERRGFPPYIIDVRRMAQTLLDRRVVKTPRQTIGKQWVYRFIKMHPELDSRLARSYDSQRAKNENPKVINE